MHVCVLTAEEFPSNGRVRRHADALHGAGHAVTVCARGGAGQPAHGIADGIDVERLADESLYAGVRGVFDGARYALRYVHPAWARAANRVDDELAVDACCVFDLSLLKTGLAVGARLDVPVVADLPGVGAAIPTHSARGGRFREVARRVFHSAWRRGRLLEALPAVERVVTTTEEARAEYVREKGIDPARVTVVRDTVSPVETDRHEPVALGFGFDPEESFVVTALADGSSKDALETLVKATARAADSVVSLRLVVVCDVDRETLDDLETLARRRLAGARVTFRTETDDATEYVAASDVCVFPSKPRGAETSIPEELFVAMAAGVPVITPDTPPIRRVLTETDAGRVVGDGVTPLAEALVALSDPATNRRIGANGRAATENEYDPARDAARLGVVYESLVVDPLASGPASRFVSAIRYEPTS